MMKFAFCLVLVLAIIMVAVKAVPGGYGSGGGGYGGGGGGYDAGNGLINSHQSQNGYDNYDFGHDVASPHYGNYHGRQETGHGNTVSGTYYLLEADGSLRRVDYTASHPGGFKATVTDKHGSKHYGNTGYGNGNDGGYGNGNDEGYENGGGDGAYGGGGH